MKKGAIFGIGLTLPVMALLFVFLLFPFLYAFYFSLFRSEFLIIQKFTGLSNYIRLIKEPEIQNAVCKSLVYLFPALSISFFVGLSFALWINTLRGTFRTVVQMVVLLPWIVSMVVAALLWRWIFMGERGIAVYLLQVLGLPSLNILESPRSAMVALIFVGSWRIIAFATVLLLAGVSGIPKEIYEAAQVDGASQIQRFHQVTLPLLKTSILITVVILTLSFFNVITVPLVFTGGGPGNSTNILSLELYRQGFVHYDFGFASTLAAVMFIVNIVFVLFYVRLLGTKLD